MASKVSKLLRVIGRQNYDAGAHLYHAAQSVSDGGHMSSEKRHRLKKLLARQRHRSSDLKGMMPN